MIRRPSAVPVSPRVPAATLCPYPPRVSAVMRRPYPLRQTLGRHPTVLFVHLLTFLFWAGVVALGVGLVRRSRLWAVGQPAPISWGSLATIPKRYFVDLHHVVAREPYIANAHIATAGGTVAALIFVALNYG